MNKKNILYDTLHKYNMKKKRKNVLVYTQMYDEYELFLIFVKIDLMYTSCCVVNYLNVFKFFLQIWIYFGFTNFV